MFFDFEKPDVRRDALQSSLAGPISGKNPLLRQR